jgi:hypothetical protein
MVGALLALGILVRLPHLIFSYVINPDGIAYIESAQAVAQGDLWGAVRGTHFSVFPLLVTLVRPVMGDWVTAARSLPLAWGLLTVVPLYLLCRELIGASRAWMPVLFYDLSPTIVHSSTDVVREPLFWFAFALTVWILLVALRTERWPLFLLAGGAALLGACVRMDGLWVVGVSAAFVAVRGFCARSGPRGLWRAAGILLPTAIAVATVFAMLPQSWKRADVLEWGRYQRQAMTAAGLSGSVENEVRGLAARSSLRVAREFVSVAWEKRHALAAWILMEHWVKTTHALLFALMLLGLAHPSSWRYGAWPFMLFLMAALLAMGYVRVSGTFTIGKRHLVPLALLAYPFAALGFSRVCEWIRARGPGATPRLVAGLVMAFVLVTTLPQALRPARAEKLGRRLAGEWIQERGVPRPVVATEHRHVAFYAQGIWVPLSRFLEGPEVEPGFLVLEWKSTEPEPSELLDRVHALGWKTERLQGFRSAGTIVEVWALRR